MISLRAAFTGGSKKKKALSGIAFFLQQVAILPAVS
jgi:hypothetical protein